MTQAVCGKHKHRYADGLVKTQSDRLGEVGEGPTFGVAADGGRRVSVAAVRRIAPRRAEAAEHRVPIGGHRLRWPAAM